MDNFDEMTVNEAIKFLDEFSDGIDCEQCPVESRECANHGCPFVRSVSAIKKEYEEKDLENHIFESVRFVGEMDDKDELTAVKALEYDRQQYKKGYADGKREFAIYMLGRIAAIEMMSGIDLVSLKDACSEVLEETGGEDNGQAKIRW